MPDATRCGFVAVVGAPNAGKSTLVNALVGAKVSIVSPKPQTTRMRVRGIVIEGSTQLVLVDTPGIFSHPRRRLERAMIRAAWDGAADADAILMVVDAKRGLDEETALILPRLKDDARPAVLALNKIDVVAKPKLLTLALQVNEAGRFSDTFMVSATTGDGIEDLKRKLAELVPVGPWLYPADQLADLPLRLMAAEATREQAFLALKQELPYALAVETESWRDLKDGSARIEQVVTVERESQKPIVLGRGGATIKAIREAAQAEIARELGRPVHLFLNVQVRADWAEERRRYQDLDLAYDV